MTDKIGRYNIWGDWVEETPEERHVNRLAEHGPAILPRDVPRVPGAPEFGTKVVWPDE